MSQDYVSLWLAKRTERLAVCFRCSTRRSMSFEIGTPAPLPPDEFLAHFARDIPDESGEPVR